MRPLALIIATLITTASLSATAIPAASSTTAEYRSKGCVTKSEFNRIKVGMSKSSVAKIFGTKGTVSTTSSGFGQTIEIRSYDGCSSFSVVSVMFTNGKMDTKSQVGL